MNLSKRPARAARLVRLREEKGEGRPPDCAQREGKSIVSTGIHSVHVEGILYAMLWGKIRQGTLDKEHRYAILIT